MIENLKLSKWVFLGNLSWTLGGLVAQNAREMVIMCSLSIDDKRVQFRFQINEMFKSKIGLEQEINKTKRVKTL